MITMLGDFDQCYAKNGDFLQNFVMIHFLHKTCSGILSRIRQFFFGEYIS
jgi:hypothetical protein